MLQHNTMKYVQNRDDVSNWQCLTLIMEDVAAKVPVDGDAGKVARLQSSRHPGKLGHHRHQQNFFRKNPETGHGDRAQV